MPANTVAANEVVTMLGDGEEIAFLDVREIVRFGAGHPLLATNLPMGRMELAIAALIPRPDTRIVVTDGGGDLSPLAGVRLRTLGYSNVAALEGGTPAWAAAGHTLFPELEVPSKGFGDFVARTTRPGFIGPPGLKHNLAGDGDWDDWIVLDSRPRTEYRAGTIPGSINAPAGQLIRCFGDLVPNPATKVVVNCMSRTRGVLGGVSLIESGVPNDVYVLENGTRGWLLEGFELERGATRHAARPSPLSRDRAREQTRLIAERAGIEFIDHGTLERMREDPGRTTYLFDVRDREDYEAGHLAGARSAPEGSLVMSPDRYVGTQNARIVLADDDTVRATVGALWLAQMGRAETYVLKDANETAPTEKGPEPSSVTGLERCVNAEIMPGALDALRREGPPVVVDVGDSEAHVQSHVPGAHWCLRSALPEALASRPGSTGPSAPLVLTSEDGVLARFATADISGCYDGEVKTLAGGNAAWREASLETGSGPERLLSPRDDFWLAASERPGDVRENVIAYLDWETALLENIERDGFMPYRNLLWDR